MKTNITFFKQFVIAAILLLTTGQALTAQTALPFGPAWPETTGFTGWTLLDKAGDHSTNPTWYRNGAQIIEFEDKQIVHDDWLVSPALDFTGNYIKEIYFHAGWAEDLPTADKWGMPGPYSNINLYYSTNFDGTNVANATWTLLATNVINKDQIPGTGVSKRLPYSFTLELTVSQVHVALQLMPTYPNNDPVFPTDNTYKTRVRVSDFYVREYVPTSIKDDLQKLAFHPNPVSSVINLDITGEAAVEVYNLAGQRVKSVAISANQVDVSDLPAGQYIIMVKQAGEVMVNKFLKK